MSKGKVEVKQEIQTVSSQGEAIALNAETVSGGGVKAYQNIDKIEKGARATSVKINKI